MEILHFCETMSTKKAASVVVLLTVLAAFANAFKKKGQEEYLDYSSSSGEDSQEVEYVDWSNITKLSDDPPKPTSRPAKQNFPGLFDPEFDIILGLRRNEFVEVKIGEFSTTDLFSRVYGKLTNYTNENGTPFQVGEFLGVPFAEPPINHLRFQRPMSVAPPDELLALRHPPPCPQLSTEDNSNTIGVEDCLYLSIYTPGLEAFEDSDYFETKTRRKLPVLVWFPGESSQQIKTGRLSVFASGSADDLDPTVWLRRNLVVVTPQYRLGPLGFLSAGSEDLNGNMGLFDMVAALEWVHRFINYFGGDPSQITVMGQGSSATGLGLLATSAISTTRPNLFQRIILMSGSPTQPLAINTNQKLTYLEAARLNNCPPLPALQFVRCMQKKSANSILQASGPLSQGKHIGKWKLPLGAIQKPPDKRFLPPLIFESPIEVLSKGKGLFQNVPVLIGVTSSEMSGFLENLSGTSRDSLRMTLFSSNSSQTVLKNFIRQLLGEFGGLSLETVSQLVSFEYFAGLKTNERQEQAEELVEEMLADYLIFMPVLTMANFWSKLAPVYFYVYDYVKTTSDEETSLDDGAENLPQSQPSQAVHGSDLDILTKSYKTSSGSSKDRLVSSLMADLWTSFVKTGIPDPSNNFWPMYSGSNKEYLYISDRFEVRKRFRFRQEQFWNELLTQIRSQCGVV